ncbi:MAG TPA: hypothetical protein PKK10_03170 [Woeseiaceae bacterium]|nr:hypothetical protein [Woeseiaceae bacterium]
MLERLQNRLNQIYQTGCVHDVRDYLITDPVLAQTIARDAMLKGTEETLLLAEQDDGLGISLFLNRALLQRLENSDPLLKLTVPSLADLWLAFEGISHFNYVVWKAAQDREVSLLELEMQAEIDKFVCTSRLAIEQGDEQVLRGLHGWLFDEVKFREDLNAEQRDRYRSANDYAARFCHRLGRSLRDDEASAISELRAFYRLPMTDKLSHIHACAWA